MSPSANADVRATGSAEFVLEHAAEFLAQDPIRNNLVLSLLSDRVANPIPGRYWIVHVDGSPAGVVFQSPLHFSATVTPMAEAAARAAVDAIVDDDVALPGVAGEAGTAARFAGHWTERTRSAASPRAGGRIYEVERVIEPNPGPGRIRSAADDDRELLVEWIHEFHAEIGEDAGDVAVIVDSRLRAGHFWMWEDGDAVALAAVRDAVAGVARIGPVYTPVGRRSRGYASRLVAAVSASVLADGLRCMLYTDLDNPTSNAIYRNIGYRAVAEVLNYRFGAET